MIAPARFVQYHTGMDTGPIAPTWFVLPLALIALVLQAGYLIAIRIACLRAGDASGSLRAG